MAADDAHGTALALRTRLLVTMLAPLLVIAALLGIAGATLIADVVRRASVMAGTRIRIFVSRK